MSTHPKSYERRKDDRPREIIAAAFEEFAAKGYADTRLQDVARRAGVSKGLPYLYFETKEELFKAVVRRLVKPRFDELMTRMEDSVLSAEEFLRGPFLDFARPFVRSRRARILRLLIAEGPKHPDLTEFYATEVLAPMTKALSARIRRDADRASIRHLGLAEFPQLIVAPVIVGSLWLNLFGSYLPLDTDRMLEAHVELLSSALRPSASH